MRFLLSAFFLFQSITCFSQFYPVKDINPLMLIGAQAVIRNNSKEVTFKNYDAMTYKVRQVMTVLEENIMDDLDFYFLYDSYDDVRRYEAKIYDAKGEHVKTLKKRDFMDVSATGSDLYSDNRAIILKYTPSMYPFTIDFSYEIKTSSTANIPGFFPFPYSKMSVESDTYTLINETQIPIKVKKMNLEAYNIEVHESQERISFKATNLSPVKYEAAAPPMSEVLPIVRLSPEIFQLKGKKGQVRNWDELANWYREELLVGMEDLPKSTIAEVSSLVKDVSDTREKVKRIYNYMQDRTRYISVQVGIGGWQPTPADEVHKLGYGDCKGLSNYTKALLKSQGIDSYFTLVDSQPDGTDVMEDYAALAFDHAILSVPLEDETLFLECTSQKIPFNFLGTHTDDRTVLMVTDSGAEIKRTPVYDYKTNYQKAHTKAVLNDAMELSGSLKMESGGLQYNNAYHRIDAKEDENLSYYKDRWGYHSDIRLSDIQFQNDKDAVRIQEQMNFHSTSYTTKAGDRILLNPNVFNRIQSSPPRYEHRKYPLYIRRGYSDDDIVEIQLPERYSVASMFEDVRLETEFGIYEIAVTVDENNQLTYHRKIELYTGRWPKEKYADYVAFFKEINKKDRSKIVLTQLK